LILPWRASLAAATRLFVLVLGGLALRAFAAATLAGALARPASPATTLLPASARLLFAALLFPSAPIVGLAVATIPTVAAPAIAALATPLPFLGLRLGRNPHQCLSGAHSEESPAGLFDDLDIRLVSRAQSKLGEGCFHRNFYAVAAYLYPFHGYLIPPAAFLLLLL
jgi:hypothetical protein